MTDVQVLFLRPSTDTVRGTGTVRVRNRRVSGTSEPSRTDDGRRLTSGELVPYERTTNKEQGTLCLRR